MTIDKTELERMRADLMRAKSRRELRVALDAYGAAKVAPDAQDLYTLTMDVDVDIVGSEIARFEKKYRMLVEPSGGEPLV